MKKYYSLLFILLLISFCSNDTISSSELAEVENRIEELEGLESLTSEEVEELLELENRIEESSSGLAEVKNRIEELEGLELLTSEEVEELLELEDRLKELGGSTDTGESDYQSDLNDPIFSKYYVKNDPDPEFNPGKYLPRHCSYSGRYKGEEYGEDTPLSEVPFSDDLKLDYYPQKLGLYSEGFFRPNARDYRGEHGEQLGEINCLPDWALKTGIGGDTIVQAENEQSGKIYGLSFYDRIFPFYSVRPEEQQGLWGQWIQAPDSHPYGPAGGTIEGGLGIFDKFGHTKYPIYMASGAPLFYNPNSSLFGYGFYEVRVACDCYGGVQLTNKVLPVPASIHFDEDQNEYNEDGGIYFGHGWFALPIFSGEEREEQSEPTTDIGKLTWTFVANSAQYSGPMWAYVPEFWHRRIDRWNAVEMLLDGEDEVSPELYSMLIEFLGGRLDRETLMDEIEKQDWYVDDVEDYDYEKGGLFWTQEKNTLAYTSTSHASIGSEMGELPAFIEYDKNGDLYMKIFPPAVPSEKDKEYFTLDGRSYDINLYNHFVDFFNGDAEIEDLDPSFSTFSKPMIAEDRYEDRERPDLNMNDLFIGGAPDAETLNDIMVSWNVYLSSDTEKGETNSYWDWSGVPNEEERDLSQYYMVEVPSSSANTDDYIFVPVDASKVPESLQGTEMNTLERTVSYMPHILSAQDKALQAKVKKDMDEVFGIDSKPYDYSCWVCDSDGCDATIYESTLDDGSIVKYRWYRFKDQPSFQSLIVDYPEIYTEEYLNLLQSRIEKMHKEWGHNQEFIPVPKTLDNLHLVELDDGQVVEPPPGKEFGWVPIVLEMEHPYGEYATNLNHSEIPCGEYPGAPECKVYEFGDSPIDAEQRLITLLP